MVLLVFFTKISFKLKFSFSKVFSISQMKILIFLDWWLLQTEANLSFLKAFGQGEQSRPSNRLPSQSLSSAIVGSSSGGSWMVSGDVYGVSGGCLRGSTCLVWPHTPPPLITILIIIHGYGGNLTVSYSHPWSLWHIPTWNKLGNHDEDGDDDDDDMECRILVFRGVEPSLLPRQQS